MSSDTPPLDGVRVLDLTRLFPGPLATMILGDLGAEVIKVEDPHTGDFTRHLPPYKGGVGASFLALNRSKLSLAVDLKDPRGRELFLKLAQTSDLVVDGFRPGVLARLGIGYTQLKQARDDIILCSISGYGQDGPLRDRAGHDVNYCAHAGVLGVTGERGGPPMLLGVQIGDVSGGTWQALAAIFAALYQREKTGVGQWLDVAMAEGALTTMAFMLSEAFVGEKMPPRGEALLAGGLPGYGVFETKDGLYLAVGGLEPHFFDTLVEALDLSQHRGKSIQTGEEGRAIRADIARVIKTRTREEWMQVFEKLDACVDPVLEGEEVLADLQLNSRGMFFSMHHPDAGTIRQMASPLRLAHRKTPRLPPPRLGEHTFSILSDIGLSQPEIESLAASQTVKLAR